MIERGAGLQRLQSLIVATLTTTIGQERSILQSPVGRHLTGWRRAGCTPESCANSRSLAILMGNCRPAHDSWRQLDGGSPSI
jgi:hypothetical protein